MATTTLNQLRQTHTDPTNLRGLKQAVFIAVRICSGVKAEQIAKLFLGDEQLVSMWVNFLRHNHWVSYSEPLQIWVLTEKGQEKVSDTILA